MYKEFVQFGMSLLGRIKLRIADVGSFNDGVFAQFYHDMIRAARESAIWPDRCSGSVIEYALELR
jgi:hypothetical protein